MKAANMGQRRVFTAIVLGYVTFVCAWGSSIYSSATYAVADAFDVGLTVSLLGVSFYVLGFALGPLVCKLPSALHLSLCGLEK